MAEITKIVMAFGTFDRVHRGHIDFLKQAKKIAPNTYLKVVIACDKNVLLAKKHLPIKNQKERYNEVDELNIADEVIMGEPDNFYKVIKKHTPDIIVLGYDQKGKGDLEDFRKQSGMNFEIVTAKEFHPELYKSSYDYKDIRNMQYAEGATKYSKDPNTKVGAVIVSKYNKMLSFGFNHFPQCIKDGKLPWSREGKLEDTKYAYVVHAEADAILRTNNLSALDGVKLYSTMYPCNECAKIIIQKGIKEVIYKTDPYHDKSEWIAARLLFKLAGVNTKKLNYDNN